MDETLGGRSIFKILPLKTTLTGLLENYIVLMHVKLLESCLACNTENLCQKATDSRLLDIIKSTNWLGNIVPELIQWFLSYERKSRKIEHCDASHWYVNSICQGLFLWSSWLPSDDAPWRHCAPYRAARACVHTHTPTLHPPLNYIKIFLKGEKITYIKKLILFFCIFPAFLLFF